ncbi:hypothetical protein HHX47_DHR4001057 [Lentinula edodes]|nr:hypothetical protein HHX47_DHR4001057 [Lentinula edodes]
MSSKHKVLRSPFALTHCQLSQALHNRLFFVVNSQLVSASVLGVVAIPTLVLVVSNTE